VLALLQERRGIPCVPRGAAAYGARFGVPSWLRRQESRAQCSNSIFWWPRLIEAASHERLALLAAIAPRRELAASNGDLR